MGKTGRNSLPSRLFPEQDELALLRRIRKLAAKQPGRVQLGIGDDCALLRLRPNEEVAVTTDLSIDGRHFRLAWHPADAVGHRALARGLSDLAAMGARPLGAFLSLGLPRELTRTKNSGAWEERFFNGLLALAAECKVPLAGGDLAESPIVLADIVLVGAVPRGRALLRSGAGPGDQIYVTGALGGAAAGLKRLEDRAGAAKAGRRRPLPAQLAAELAAHLYPQPRLAQGLWLQRRGSATAAIDVSDGLSTDLTHLCEESGVAAEVESELIPINAAASLQQALHGGEDYELLFTAKKGVRIPDAIAGVAVTRIGRVIRRRSGRPLVTIVDGNNRHPLLPQGWRHFS